MEKLNKGGRPKGVKNNTSLFGPNTSVQVSNEIIPQIREIIADWKKRKVEEKQREQKQNDGS